MRRLNALALLGALVFAAWMGGCVTAEYEGFRVTRFATDTGLESASVKIDPDGVKEITLTGYTSEQSKAIDLAREAMRTMRGATP